MADNNDTRTDEADIRAWCTEIIDDKPDGAYRGTYLSGDKRCARKVLDLLDNRAAPSRPPVAGDVHAIERAAHALCEAEGYDWDDLTLAAVLDYRRKASAVLAAALGWRKTEGA